MSHYFYLRKSANEKYEPNVCCYCLLNKWDTEQNFWLDLIGIDPLWRHLLQKRELCLLSVFEKLHLYIFRNKEIILYVRKNIKTEKVRHHWQSYIIEQMTAMIYLQDQDENGMQSSIFLRSAP